MQKRFIVIFFAGFLCVFTVATFALAINESAVKDATDAGIQNMTTQKEAKVVFHIDADQQDRLHLGLENMKNLHKAIPAEKTSVHMVANGKAVKLFTKEGIGADLHEMEELSKRGVIFGVCRNALTSHRIEEKDLLPFCKVVPAGIVELIQLQQNGYAYVKP